MNAWDIVWGLVGGIVSGCGVAAFAAYIGKVAQERWMASVKADYDREMLAIKNLFDGEQKRLQAQLDQGSHITRAHYDLELESYRTLWVSIADVRSTARAIKGVFVYGIHLDAPDATVTAAFNSALSKFTEAHNRAVVVCETAAPFYDKAVQVAARTLTSTSGALHMDMSEFAVRALPEVWNLAEDRLNDLLVQIEALDGLIRKRLESIRILP